MNNIKFDRPEFIINMLTSANLSGDYKDVVDYMLKIDSYNDIIGLGSPIYRNEKYRKYMNYDIYKLLLITYYHNTGHILNNLVQELFITKNGTNTLKDLITNSLIYGKEYANKLLLEIYKTAFILGEDDFLIYLGEYHPINSLTSFLKYQEHKKFEMNKYLIFDISKLIDNYNTLMDEVNTFNDSEVSYILSEEINSQSLEAYQKGLNIRYENLEIVKKYILPDISFIIDNYL